MKTNCLTPEQTGLTCNAINYCGDGGHPVADEESLAYFEAPYVIKCLERAVRGGRLNSSGEKVARAALKRIRGAHK
jgi:hypothetical protein